MQIEEGGKFEMKLDGFFLNPSTSSHKMQFGLAGEKIRKKRRAFCEECREMVNYNVIERDMLAVIKSTKYHYRGKEAICPVCGNKLYVPKIVDANLDALYKVRRRQQFGTTNHRRK
jgi:hypothetical protein